MIIGFITSILCFLAVKLKVRLKFDDALDTFAVHGVGGTFGALLAGVFAKAELISSYPAAEVLLDQGRIGLIIGQLEAVIIAYGISAGDTLLIALLLTKFGCDFRLTKAQEEIGLDMNEHGEEAYSEKIGSPMIS